jgi:hypothetical protein
LVHSLAVIQAANEQMNPMPIETAGAQPTMRA